MVIKLLRVISKMKINSSFMNEIIYTSYSQLGSPRIFLYELKKDLRAAKELGWRLFITNLRSQYRQSWLGYIWLIVPPLLTGLVWIFLGRSQIIVTNTSPENYPVFVISGIFIWQTLIESLNMPIEQLSNQKHILSKVKSPHEAFIFAGTGGILFNLFLRVVLLLILLVIFNVPLNLTILLFPLGLVSIIVFGLAIGLFLTPIGLLYSDIRNGINAVASLLFFITPIIYQIPTHSGVWRLLRFNPITPLLNTSRNWLMGSSISPENGFFIISALSFILLMGSWVVYRLAKPHLIARF